MANKALEHDGDFFEGKRIRLSKHDGSFTFVHVVEIHNFASRI